MADKTWKICILCQGNGEIKEKTVIGQPLNTITCPRCEGEKVEVISIIEATAEDARGMFGLSEPE